MTKRKSLWAGIIAAGLTALLLLAVYAACGLFPCGSLSLGWGDMKQQIAPLFLQFRNILLGNQGFFLNLASGGMDFWGVFFFFLCSPFSFLVLLIQPEQIYVFLNLLVLFKMVAAAFCMGWFLLRRFPRMAIWHGALFGVSYGFCGYCLLYYVNVHWLDLVILLPLLMEAFLYLVRTGKSRWFVLMVFVHLVISLYISYMVLLFLAMAAGAYVWFCVPARRRGPTALRICCGVGLSFLLSAAAWLPFLKQYWQSARTTDFILSLQSGGFFPNLFTTSCLLLLSAFSCAGILWCLPRLREQRKRNLLFWLGLGFLMTVPLFIEPINKFWHIGSYQAYPGRYAFLTNFLWIWGAAWAWEQKSEIRGVPPRSSRLLTGAYGLFLFGMGLLFAIFLPAQASELATFCHTLWVGEEQWQTLFLVFAFLLVAFLLLFGMRRYELAGKRTVSCFLTATVLLQSLVFGFAFFQGSVQNTSYEEDFIHLGETANENKEDAVFFFKQNSKTTDVNLLGGAGFMNHGHYTSLTSRNMLFAMKKLGYSCYWMETGTHGGTQFTDALLGIQGVVFQNAESWSSDRYNQVLAQNDTFTLLQLTDSWGTGLVVPEALPQEIASSDRLLYQESLYETLFPGKEDLFHFYDPQSVEGLYTSYDSDSQLYSYQLDEGESEGVVRYSIQLSEDETLYLDLFKDVSNRLTEPINGALNVFVNGCMVASSYPKQSMNGLLELGDFKAGETVSVDVWFSKNVDVYGSRVAGLRNDVWDQVTKEANGCDITVDGSTLSATVQAETEGQWLFLPVEYQDGMIAWCNGAPTEVRRVLGAFTAIRLTEGESEVLLSVWPSGLTAGILLTGIGILLLALWWLAKKKGWMEHSTWIRKIQNGSVYVLVTISAAAFAVAYLFPVLLYLLRAS